MGHILHLSDLHLNTLVRAETAIGQLRSDLINEIGIKRLDAIIITGDIAESAQPSEYEASAAFVTELCSEMDVARENILVVPGNHDVDWEAARASYSVVRASEAPASSVSRYQNPANRDYVEVVTDSDLYQRRFANYAQFHLAVTGRHYAPEYSEQFEVVTSADESVVLVGVNSAWNLDHYHPGRSSIEAGALNHALVAARRRVQEIDSPAPIVVVWHHPVHGDDALKDISFLQRLVVDDVVAVLHGHVHKPDSEQFNYEWSAHGRRLFSLGAGTLDSPDVHRGYPWHYSLISIDGQQLEVRSRAKSERDGAWHPDARFLSARGKPPVDVLTLELRRSAAHSGAVLQASIAPSDRRVGLLRTVSALKAYLEQNAYDVMGYRIAVEALLFDPNGKLLLQERGPECRDEVGKLECIGGQVFDEDLIECTANHVRRVAGQDVRIEVDELLDVQPTRFVERQGPEDWITVCYLCRLTGGEPSPVNTGKTTALVWLELAELHALDDERLSRSTSRARDIYRAKFRTNPYFSHAGRLA